MSDEMIAKAREMVAETPKLPEIDVREKAGFHTGNPQTLDERLFMQLFVYRVAREADTDALIERLGAAMTSAECAGVIYRDVNDPRGIGVLSWSVDPTHFVTKFRSVLVQHEFAALSLDEDFTMLGRSYSTGYESDLRYWLIDRPIEHAVDAQYDWAVWYPLRRLGAFEKLSIKEQAGILREHAAIGRAYGEQGLATDIRLACHGLDAKDNEFVIGLVGKELYPLSHLVQRMRKTQQTSEYIQNMGPFFVGYAVWRRR
jgi:chlorite dismutase